MCNIFVVAKKLTTLRNKTGFILYTLNSPPLKSRVKKSVKFLGSIAPIKTRQNIGENIVQCWFYETSIKFLRLISKTPPPLLLIFRKILILISWNQQWIGSIRWTYLSFRSVCIHKFIRFDCIRIKSYSYF